MSAVRVSDYMTPEVVVLHEQDTLRSGMELTVVRQIRHVPVLGAQEKLVGIITDHDILRALPSPLAPIRSGDYESLLDQTPVARVMTHSPVSVEVDTKIEDAVQLMLSRRIRGLPVLKDGSLVGMFTQSDALRAYIDLLGGRPKTRPSLARRG